MAEEIIFYISNADRQIQINLIELAGKTVLHDDFVDAKGDPTDGTSGRLTFDTRIDPVDPDEIKRREIEKKILSKETITEADLIELKRIELERG